MVMKKNEKDEIIKWIKDDFWSSFIEHVTWEYYIKYGMKSYDRVFCEFDDLFVNNGKITNYFSLWERYDMNHIKENIKGYNSLYDYIKYRRKYIRGLCNKGNKGNNDVRIVGKYLLLRYFNYFQCNNNLYKQDGELKMTEYKKKINGIVCINNYGDFVKRSNDYLQKISEEFYNEYLKPYEK